ncbi:MAG: AAA family ATPase [Succinivibrionaceae bacterium]|nr:AAA family ATPase [Succinivibrionaceae bacterium]
MIMQQSFANLVTYGFYVDKTEPIYNLVKSRCALLVRPRKFGKSLLVSTLKELFEGHREYFANTFIDRSDYDFRPHTVLSFNFHYDVTSASELALILKQTVREKAQAFGVTLSRDKPDEMFRELVDALPADLVVLVDNYDFVLADNISNPEVEKIDQVLARFVGVMNDKNRFRFVFLTGINHFQLCDEGYGQVLDYEDYTGRSEVASICGFSQIDLEIHYINKMLNLSSPAYVKAHGIDEMLGSGVCGSKLTQLYAEYLTQKKQSADDLIRIIMRTVGGYSFSDKKTNLASAGFVLDFMRSNGTFNLNYDMRCARGYIVSKLRSPLFNLSDYVNQPLDPELSCGPHYSYRPQLGSLLLHNGILTIRDLVMDEDSVQCFLKVPNLEISNFIEKRVGK